MPFEERVAFFIREFYLSSELKSDEDLERLYAPVVDYFANRRISRERVLADKRAYFAKWPARAYRLVRDTLRVVRRPGDAKIYDVTFRYVFDVASPRRTSRGLGLAELTLDLTSDGGRITRETGRVLERW